MTNRTATIELDIEGMDCGSCADDIEAAVGGLPGVKDVRVSLADNNAVIVLDAALVTRDALVEAIEDAGFDVAR